MNKTIKYILLSCAIQLTSCNDVLDVIPYTSLTEETIFTNADGVELAVVGVYDAAQTGFYQGGLAPRGYPFGAANLQQDDLRGEDMINMESFFQITYNTTYVATSPNCYNMWNTCYSLINKANLVEEGINQAILNGVITEEKGRTYIAECRFLRALTMHQLLVDFARPYADGQGSQLGVVIRNLAIKDDATIEQADATGRSSVADCYKFIEDDLVYAENNLPASLTSNSTYRATKAAAIALKIRVLLYQNKWTEILSESAKIVQSSNGTFSSPIGGWTLTSTPDGPFANNTSLENIFSIENTPTDQASVSGALQSMFGSNGSTVGARGLIGISPILWNLPEWDATDLRRSMVAANFANNDPTKAPSGKKPMLFTTKYYDPAWGDDAPQIRYAEVLLILAEAYVRDKLVVDQTALSYLNAVRNRAVTTVSKQYTLSSFPDYKSFIKAVLAERRIEFVAEGKRWGDIHRLALDPDFNNFTLLGTSAATGGIPAKVLASNISTSNFNTLYSGTTAYTNIPKGLTEIPFEDYRFIWPLSATEITYSHSKAVVQNPGYSQE